MKYCENASKKAPIYVPYAALFPAPSRARPTNPTQSSASFVEMTPLTHLTRRWKGGKVMHWRSRAAIGGLLGLVVGIMFVMVLFYSSAEGRVTLAFAILPGIVIVATCIVVGALVGIRSGEELHPSRSQAEQ